MANIVMYPGSLGVLIKNPVYAALIDAGESLKGCIDEYEEFRKKTQNSIEELEHKRDLLITKILPETEQRYANLKEPVYVEPLDDRSALHAKEQYRRDMQKYKVDRYDFEESIKRIKLDGIPEKERQIAAKKLLLERPMLDDLIAEVETQLKLIKKEMKKYE